MFTVNSNFTLINLGYLTFFNNASHGTLFDFSLDKPENLLDIYL